MSASDPKRTFEFRGIHADSCWSEARAQTRVEVLVVFRSPAYRWYGLLTQVAWQADVQA